MALSPQSKKSTSRTPSVGKKSSAAKSATKKATTYSFSTKAPQRGPINPNPPKKASPSLATRIGAKAKELTSSAKALASKTGSKLVAGATSPKTRKIGGRAAIGLAAVGAADALYNRLKSSGKPAAKAAAPKPSPAKPAASKAPVQSDLAKKYNRRDDVGKPATPTVLKKPTTPAKKAVTKKPVVAKRPGQVALAKGISAKDLKPSTPATIGKPEVKSLNFSKPSVSSEKPEYSKVQIARMETRAEKKEDRKENRAERKSERMENRAERLEKRAGKLKGKLKYGGAVKAKNGKSFPDLNKDGKITKADILKGRGVIAKKGASVRKAGLGDILGKVAGSGAFGLAGMAANKLFGGKKKAAAPAMGAAPMAAPAAVPAVAPMKKGGKISAKKKMMKSGGKMAKCKYGCK